MWVVVMRSFGNTAATMLGKCLHTLFAHSGFRRVSCPTPLLLGEGMCSTISTGSDDAGNGIDGWSCQHINLTRCSRSFCCLPGTAFIPTGLAHVPALLKKARKQPLKSHHQFKKTGICLHHARCYCLQLGRPCCFGVLAWHLCAATRGPSSRLGADQWLPAPCPTKQHGPSC